MLQSPTESEESGKPGFDARAVSFLKWDWRCRLKPSLLKRRASGWRCLAGGTSILPLCFPTRHGLGVAWTGVEDHPPEPPGLDSVTALLGQHGEISQREVAVDALVDATELVGTLQRQDPPPATFRNKHKGRKGPPTIPWCQQGAGPLPRRPSKTLWFESRRRGTLKRRSSGNQAPRPLGHEHHIHAASAIHGLVP